MYRYTENGDGSIIVESDCDGPCTDILPDVTVMPEIYVQGEPVDCARYDMFRDREYDTLRVIEAHPGCEGEEAECYGFFAINSEECG